MMVGSRRWIVPVATYLIGELGDERALEIARGMRSIPGPNRSARETLELLEKEIEVQKEGGGDG